MKYSQIRLLVVPGQWTFLLEDLEALLMIKSVLDHVLPYFLRGYFYVISHQREAIICYLIINN